MILAALLDHFDLSNRAASLPHAETVTEFPAPQYTGKQVVKAGRALLEPMPWISDDDERSNHYRSVFRIAYDWRASHAYPMRRIRQELRANLYIARMKGLTAARLKRMSSIRKKLERNTITLAQIQDIGGCRAILHDSNSVMALIQSYREGNTSHKVREERSYIEMPRPSGYRSHHIVLEFRPGDRAEEPYEGRRIELQLRTRLQHSWATAVESMGLVLRQDLKAGQGNADWLRFFELTSSAFARFEGTPDVPNAPKGNGLVAEIKEMNKKLGALVRLETINQSFNFYENNTSLGARYFLIQFDNSARTMEVTGYEQASRASARYGDQEEQHSNRDTVMVEVDRVRDLKEAYPNYYLDVSLFTHNLVRILNGEPLITTISRQRLQKTAQEYDLNWLKNWQFFRRKAKRH